MRVLGTMNPEHADELELDVAACSGSANGSSMKGKKRVAIHSVAQGDRVHPSGDEDDKDGDKDIDSDDDKDDDKDSAEGNGVQPREEDDNEDAGVQPASATEGSADAVSADGLSPHAAASASSAAADGAAAANGHPAESPQDAVPPPPAAAAAAGAEEAAEERAEEDVVPEDGGSPVANGERFDEGQHVDEDEAAEEGEPLDEADDQDYQPSTEATTELSASATTASVMSPTLGQDPAPAYAPATSPLEMASHTRPEAEAEAPGPGPAPPQPSVAAAAAQQGGAAPPEQDALSVTASSSSSALRQPGSGAGKGKKDDSTLFATRALKSILLHLNPKRFPQLRGAVAEVVGLLEAAGETPTTIKMPGSASEALPIQVYTKVLRQACETADPKVVPIALDCMQKIMSFGEVSDETQGCLPVLSFAKRAKMTIPPKEETEDHKWKGQKVGVLTEMVTAICGCANDTTVPMTESIQLQTCKALLTAVTEKGLHSWALRLAVSTIFNICVKTSGTPYAPMARTTLTQVINWIFQKMETAAANSLLKDVEMDDETGMTVGHSDAWHLLHFFSEQAKSVEVTEYTPTEAVEMKVLTTALELIQRLVASAGPGFKENAAFLQAAKEPLFGAVVQGCLSPVPTVGLIGLNIAISLAFSFKHGYKREIGILFTHVILKVLESPHSSTEQKTLVIQAIGKLLANPQGMVDVFINYDCDIQQERLFELMLNQLSHFIMGQQDIDWATKQQEQMLKGLALQNLVSVLKSMEQWMKKCRDGDTRVSAGPFMVAGAKAASFATVEKHRKTKVLLEEAAALFSTKPDKGMKLLVHNGLATGDPAGIATALEKYKKLERGMVGEYLGDENHSDVLEAFCRLHDLQDTTLDGALRGFLARFSLPKEGQKIERVLEHFSNAYFEMNPKGTCRSDEAVFVLTVGIVMLNTDLHNPRVEKKMSKEKFTSQFRGVNDGQDFDTTFLHETYDAILRNPMKDLQQLTTLTKEAGNYDGGFFNAFTSRRDKKIAAYQAEAQRLTVQATLLLYDTCPGQYTYYYAVDIEHIKPMFSVCWTGMLACFSRHFEAEDTYENMVNFCLDGVSKGLHVAASFELHTEREAYMRCLCSMTAASDRSRQLQPKNILAMKSLLRVPFVDSDALYASWLPFLRCVSEVQQLKSFGAAVRQKVPGALGEGSVSSVSSRSSTVPKRRTPHASVPSSQVEQANAKLVMQHIDEQSIHKVISYSTVVSQAGLKEFVCHLCSVALEEVNMVNPRTFLLEKVVEVASDNMGPRILSIWKDISHLLVAVGTHSNSDVAEYGVDNLRQLVMKSIGKRELLECMIQPELIEPFYGIMESSLPTKGVRDLILRCLLQLVQVKSDQIGPGWPVVLKVLIAGITRHKEPLALEMAADIMKKLISPENLQYVTPYIEPIVYCLTFIASDTKLVPDMSQKFAATLARFPVVVSQIQGDNGCSETAWEWVLESFAYLSLDSDEVVRSRSISVLGHALRSAEQMPSSVWEVWSTRFAVAITLQPFMNYQQLTKAEHYAHLRYHNIMGKVDRVDPKEWLTSALPVVLQDLFLEPAVAHCKDPAMRRCIPSVIAVVCRIAKRNSMRDVHLAMRVLQSLFDAVTPHFTKEDWEVALQHILSLFRHALIRVDSLAPQMTPSAEVADAVASSSVFPEPRDLCPDQFKHILAGHSASLVAENGRPELRPVSIARATPAKPLVTGPYDMSSHSRLKVTDTTDINGWVFMLYGNETSKRPAPQATGGEAEEKMLEDLNIRCARQAGLVVLLEKLLLSDNGFQWMTEDSSLRQETFEALHYCVRCCIDTAGVFFSDNLSAWRATLRPEVIETMRRRRSKALSLNIGILFSAFNAPRAVLRNMARASVPTSALTLLNDFHNSDELPSLEPAVMCLLKNVMALPPTDFSTTKAHLYVPVCKCIPLNVSHPLRQLISDFLIRCRPV
ncbi:Brefeldin A-inhibited guanine nucleotide-exchange protein 3 [Diplonema papillatum]|nr:Brefeldin A-inhibited guanine nucleotide-exchange protein 3 [Diplonema papillatum]